MTAVFPCWSRPGARRPTTCFVEPASSSGAPAGRVLDALDRARHDWNATPEQALRFRQRQLEAIIAGWPVWIFARCSLVVVAAAVCWDHFSHLLIVSAIAVTVLCTAIRLLAARPVRAGSNAIAPSIAAYLITQGISGVIDAAALGAMFAVTGGNGRMILAAVGGALIGYCGWSLSYFPRAAATWLLTFAVAATAILIGGFGARYLSLTVLLDVDCLLILGYVLGSVTTFLSRLRSEDEAAGQRETLELLLSDFESGASDWLWETDDAGHLLRASDRFAEVLGCSPSTLTGRTLADTLPFASAPDADRLAAVLAGDTAFHGVGVDVTIERERRHLKLSGKPTSSSAASGGWRGVGADVTAEVRAQQELIRLAEFDSLTGLANRHRVLTVMDQWLSGSPHVPCTLVLFDLDDFKVVNDTLGHGAGDELLSEVAHRLQALAGPEDLLGRLGGDEFVLLRRAELSDADAEVLYARAQADVRVPARIHGRLFETRLSAGVAHAPQHGKDAEALLAHADLALYEAKRAGGDAMSFFYPELQEATERRRALLEDLRGAVRNDQLYLVFQPQVDPRTARVTGYEALLRWRHPRRGVVGPNEFIPLAEESGLISEIGEWVLRRACADAVALPADTTISVNVSAGQLKSGELERILDSALREAGLHHDRLAIEVTESVLISEGSEAQAQLHRIRKRGVKIALDDFGTGYSSLNYLRVLPIDTLKIDRSFVLELGDDPGPDTLALIRAIIAMAAALGLETVVEGIETPTQLNRFAELGVSLVQGFVYAQPLPLADALSFAPAALGSDALSRAA